MQFGLIHYRTPGDTLEQFLDFAANTGFNAVELMISDIWPIEEPSPERRAEWARSQLDRRALNISALGAGNDFVFLDEQAIQVQVNRLRRVSKLAALIGCKVLRTEGGQRKEQVPQEREEYAITEHLKCCADIAESDDILLAVDNHGVVTNDVDLLVRILREVGSPRVGANMDTGNFRWAGCSVEDCRRCYEKIAPFAQHLHLKDCIGSGPNYRGTILGQGEIDIHHAIKALQHVDYQGVYCAEWEGPADEDGAVAYTHCLQWMKSNINI